MSHFVRQLLRDGATAVLPITITVLALHFTVVPLPGDFLERFVVGTVLVGAGIALFLWGVRLGLTPLGEFLGSALAQRGNIVLILLSGFGLGAMITAADPDVRVLARMVTTVDPSLTADTIIVTVAVGIGAFVVVSMLRVFLQIPFPRLLLVLYAALFVMSAFAPDALIPAAFDAGGVTTGPVVVPFILALNVGIVSSLATRDRLADSFGLVALACVGPVFALLLLGILR